LDNKYKNLHFCVFGCKAYVFLSSEVYDKLVLYSELMMFIRYENNCFMCHIQENIIFCFTHAVFDEELFLNVLTLI